MMTEKESKDLDRILQLSLKTGRSIFSIERLKNEIFIIEDESYIRKLFFILRDNEHSLLYPKNGGLTPNCFYANSNAESFLIKGGFEKLFIEQEKQHSKDKRKEKIEILDVKIKTWQVKTKWYPYAVSTLAFGFSLFTYFNQKSSPEIQSMQVSIIKLQSNVKSLDSLFRLDTHLKIDTLKNQ